MLCTSWWIHRESGEMIPFRRLWCRDWPPLAEDSEKTRVAPPALRIIYTSGASGCLDTYPFTIWFCSATAAAHSFNSENHMCNSNLDCNAQISINILKLTLKKGGNLLECVQPTLPYSDHLKIFSAKFRRYYATHKLLCTYLPSLKSMAAVLEQQTRHPWWRMWLNTHTIILINMQISNAKLFTGFKQ